MNSLDKLRIIYKAIDDKQGADIKMIDISEISTIADYFIIASASNVNQMNAIVENIEDELLKEKVHSPKIEGKRESSWILMDYTDIIVHLFLEEDRQFYDIERIWRDGKEITL